MAGYNASDLDTFAGTSFESYRQNNFKNQFDKSRQPRGGALKLFDIYSVKLYYSATTGFNTELFLFQNIKGSLQEITLSEYVDEV